jgi:beta-lactamase regulating signal transducer with metallopeptidase domain
MTLIATLSASTSVLALLANSAVRTLALSGAVGLGLVAFRVKSTMVRLFAWTAVLYAGLAMPLLQRALPTVLVTTPAFLQSAEAQPFASTLDAANGEVVRAHVAAETASSDVIVHRTASVSRVDRDLRPSRETVSVAASKASSPRFLTSRGTSLLSSIPWSAVAAGIYFAVALLLLVRFCVGLAFGRRLRQASQWIDDPRITARIASRAHSYGLSLIPKAAESELISVPLTMGVLRATILLPAGWREWDDAKLDAVVAHEVSHVARRDALTQRLSLLHRAIFWFSPLAWWLDRHLADLAEQASDEAALACGADREDYARTLLGFFEALQGAPGRVWWQGVAMAKAGQAEKRLERILSWKGSVAMRLKKPIAIVVLAFAVPVVYLAASVHPANKADDLHGVAVAQERTPPPAPRPAPAATTQPEATPVVAPQAAPPPTPESAEITSAPAAITGVVGGGINGGVSGGVAVAPIHGVAPVAGIAPAGPVTPLASSESSGWGGGSDPQGNLRKAQAMAALAVARMHSASSQANGVGPSSSYGHGYSYSYGYDDQQRFVIVTGKTDALTMSGSTDDARHVEKLRKSIAGDFIWFQRDEKSYVIRDQATIDRARKLWAPQDEIGKKQEELGKQEEALGKQQEELGAKMEQIHVNVPDMTAELDKLKAELKKLSAGATAEQIGDVQSEIGDLQSKIGDIQSKAGDQQSRLGEQMSALGEKQGKLGEEQGKLGEQQGRLAQEASRQMKQLLDEAIAKGTAQPEL